MWRSDGTSAIVCSSAAFTGAYLFWKRRRRTGKQKPTAAPPRIAPKLETATALYKDLESALSAQGITRAISLPPLRHATELTEQKHPLASEIIDLTQVYLKARFGRRTLDDEAKRDFERRVREIRLHKPPPGPRIS